LRLEFSGYDSPDIYALALDGTHGVAVDNIPLRGSSGLIFTSTSQNMLQSIYQNLNAKLVILQFGGNVAPAMHDNYDGYEASFYSQLITLKKLIPGVTVIVIGIADMSIKDKDKYVSYPNVAIIRDALKNATFKAKCAYWDTYEAMGGANSMPSWVFSDPPLAEKDFIHFTVKGSSIVAQMFYKALMFEYNEYYNQFIKKNHLTSNNVANSAK
jgi:lysophospholipase L1-like esterase